MNTQAIDLFDTNGAGPETPGQAARPVWQAMRRGALLRCPNCGQGPLYRAYLKVNDHCPACGEALHHQRADDAPPYVTILIVGHLVIGTMLSVDIAYAWPLWLHAMVWLPLTIALSLGLLPIAKGALIGLQWALRMHGFGGEGEDAEALVPVASRISAN